MDINIVMATHKRNDYIVPSYVNKIEVNAASQTERWNNYLYDDEGENISKKNYCYSELTAMYWLWKNSSSSIKGLCHYRRFFSGDFNTTIESGIECLPKYIEKNSIKKDMIEKIFDRGVDVILPKPYLPYPKTVLDELKKYVYDKDINILTEVVKEIQPEYYPYLDNILSGTNASYFNMIIAKSSVYDNYCEWLFDILFEVERRCDISNYDSQHKRLYGYLSEVLINVYFKKNKFKIQYVKILFVKESFGIKDFFVLKVKELSNTIQRLLCNSNLYTLFVAIYRVTNKTKYNRYLLCKKYEKS